MQLASNPAIDMPIPQLVVRASCASIASVVSIGSVQSRPEGRYDSSTQMIEWHSKLDAGQKLRLELLLQLTDHLAVAPADSVEVMISATVPDRLFTDAVVSIDAASDGAGIPLVPMLANPKRIRIALKAV